MKIIDISKCNEDVINYINKLQNNYFELEKLNNEKDKEIERLNNIINKFDDFIIELYNHIPYGDESDEFMLIIEKWNELNDTQELKGSDKE